VVDDNKDIVELLTHLFEDEGYEVISANCGEECLEKIEENNVHLVILDMLLPDFSGADVLKRIRGDKKNHLVKVLMLTAFNIGKEAEEKLISEGVDGIMTKPVPIGKLLQWVETEVR